MFCYFHSFPVPLLIGPLFTTFSGSLVPSSIKRSKNPTLLSVDVLAPCLDFSSVQSLGTTMANTSLNSCDFRTLSFSVDVVKLGDALTSKSQGFKSESIKISYPYISKQCLSLIITLCTAFML